MRKATSAAIVSAATAAILLVSQPRPPAQEKDYEPFPDAMTGKALPPFEVRGLYGETYTDELIEGSPAVIVFGTSW